MTGDELRLDALPAARRLGDAGRSLSAQRDGAGSALAAASAARPWGDDEAGRAFESRYRPMEAHVLSAWAQLARYVEGLGDSAARSIRDSQDADAEVDAATARRVTQEMP